MTTPIPTCTGCHRPLTRVSRIIWEHLILDDDIYRSVAIADGSVSTDVVGGEDGPFGIASDTSVQCSFCDTELPRDGARKYFYQRWWEVVQLSGRITARQDGM